MALQLGNTKIGGMQFNGVTIGEAMMDGQIVFTSGHPLPRSQPDYWYPLDYSSDAYWNYGSRETRLGFESGSFADRGQHAWVWDGKPRIEITEPWDGNFSFGAWFEKTGDNSGSQEWLFSRGWDGAGTCIYVLLPSGDKTEIALRIDDGTTRSAWEYSPKGVIPQSGWFHFALTSEISDGRNQYRAYVNGVEVWAIRFIATFGLLSFAPSDWASVANASTTADVPFNGNVDDIAFWSRTLSASEVAAIANKGQVPAESLDVPVVEITSTTPQGAFVQFREALAAYGLDSATVEYLPFQLDTSQATDLSWMFVDCLALKAVPPMDLSNVTNTEAMFWSCNALESVPDLLTGNVVNTKNMFQNCVSLTDGNVRLIGKHPNVDTTGMLTNTALTREPWFYPDGSPNPPNFSLEIQPHVWLANNITTQHNYGSLGNAVPMGVPTYPLNDNGNWVAAHRGGHHRIAVNNVPWTDGGTIACWFKDPGGSSTGPKTIVQRASLPGVSNTWELYMSVDPANGRLITGTQVNGVWWDTIQTTRNLVDGGWHYVAATLSRSGTQWTLTGHIDGYRSTTTRTGLVSAGNFPDNTFYSGGGRDGSVSNADIDDVILVDRALTNAEIATIRSQGRRDP